MDIEDLLGMLLGGVARVAEFLWWWGPTPSKRPQPRSQAYLALHRLGLAAVVLGTAAFCWSLFRS